MTRDIITHSKAGGKACGLGVKYSACNAQPCDPKKLQLTAAKMAEKLEETKLVVANATKTSSEEKAKIVQLKKNATAAMAAEKAAHKKLEGMKAALSAASGRRRLLSCRWQPQRGRMLAGCAC